MQNKKRTFLYRCGCFLFLLLFCSGCIASNRPYTPRQKAFLSAYSAKDDWTEGWEFDAEYDQWVITDTQKGFWYSTEEQTGRFSGAYVEQNNSYYQWVPELERWIKDDDNGQYDEAYCFWTVTDQDGTRYFYKDKGGALVGKLTVDGLAYSYQCIENSYEETDPLSLYLLGNMYYGYRLKEAGWQYQEDTRLWMAEDAYLDGVSYWAEKENGAVVEGRYADDTFRYDRLARRWLTVKS